MTSLKETWQTQRQHRQQEVLHRRQQVQITLEQLSQERQMQADDLRQDLRTFQQQLQQNTQTLIAAIATQREAQASLTMQQLRAFTESLSEQVAEFLALTIADRAVKTEELWHSLEDSHQNLSATVAEMRQKINDRLEAIRLETLSLLQNHQQIRLQTQVQLQQNIADALAELRNEVKTYLAEMEARRHDRKNQLQQMLRYDREQRMAEMEQQQIRFGGLRSNRAEFRTELRRQVWGTPRSVAPVVAPIAAPITVAPIAKAQPVRAKLAETKPLSKTRSIPQSQSRSTPYSKSSAAVIPTSRIRVPVQPELSPLEQTIFDHLQRVQKATLAEIQAKFGINRFAAVDALRMLIRKGCIIQRDQLYFVQP